jgi:myo-inositol-1(or 4)-monophosphatase
MPAAWVDAAQAALDASGAAIRPYFRAGVTADLKADESPVTVADRLAEEILREKLGKQFPDFGLLGEEFPATRQDARYVWVIDPIDGTRAFLTGRPSFCTLLGLLEDGVPILGLIDQPITGERWIGQVGQPTRFEAPLGGAPGTRTCASLGRAELSCTDPAMMRGDSARPFAALQHAVARTSWGGDCYAYGLLALGQIDIIAERTMKVWDWTALVPVIEGAGGRVTDWAGRRLRPDSDGSVLAVGDPALSAAAAALLHGVR